MDKNNDLPDVSQFDFDSRDSVIGEPSPFILDKYLHTNQDLSTLPNCGNSLQKQHEKYNASLHSSNYDDQDQDNDSVGSMTPLLSS